MLSVHYENKIKEIDLLKLEIDKHRPLSKEVLLKLKEYYRIGLTYSSNALEGNSLTETETKVVLEDGITIGGKPIRDHYEAMGHSEGYDFLYELVQKKTISEKNILHLHHLFYYRIDEQKAGKYRSEKVIITGTDYIPPSPKEVPPLMGKFISDIPKLKKKVHPIEYAARLHLDFVTIHPFVDGNGRTARLLMNLALLQSGYCIAIIPPIRRQDYIYSIQKSQTGSKDKQLFINFISSAVYESMKEYLRLLNAL